MCADGGYFVIAFDFLFFFNWEWERNELNGMKVNEDDANDTNKIRLLNRSTLNVLIGHNNFLAEDNVAAVVTSHSIAVEISVTTWKNNSNNNNNNKHDLDRHSLELFLNDFKWNHTSKNKWKLGCEHGMGEQTHTKVLFGAFDLSIIVKNQSVRNVKSNTFSPNFL